MDWSLLHTGKFFSSGTIYYDASDGYYKDSRIMLTEGNVFVNALYDTVTLSGDMYKYKSDEEAYLYVEDTSLRIGLDKAVSFLKDEERNFLLNKFNTARQKCLELCEGEIFSSFVIVVPPYAKVPKHKHSSAQNFTFTYVVSSNHNKPIGSVGLDGLDPIIYPDASEFFCLMDTSIVHNTHRDPEDKNVYIFFVFDGVTFKDHDLTLHQFYTVE